MATPRREQSITRDLAAWADESGFAVTTTANWRVVELIDAQGKRIARARVPADPHPPTLLEWSNRFFRALHVNNQYLETTCYLVPVEDMYAAEPLPSSKRTGEMT